MRKQSEWRRVILSSIGDGVISTDSEGRVTFLNSVAESLTGWPRADALGRPLPDIFCIVNEETRQAPENPALRALTEGAIVGLANHSVLIAKDGTEHPIDDSAAPIRDEDGAVLGAVLVFREVTQQRRIDRERQESEERFRSLVVATSQVVWRIDRRGELVEDSPSWRAFTGQSYEQLKGRGWLAAIHPVDRKQAAETWRQCVQQKRIYQTEHRLRAADGSYRWAAVRAVPVMQADGRVREWVGMSTDITERKQAEALLSTQRDALEMLAWGVPLMRVLEFLAGAVQTQSGQAAMVAIHLLDESGTLFAQTAAPSLPPSYAQAIDGMEVSSGAGPCCAAVSRRQRVAVADVAASVEFTEFAAFALPLGVRAGWSAPIFSSTGKVLGTVATYYREVRLPEPQDDLLGEIVTRTAAIAIERKQAEEALRQSEERFHMLADNMSQLAWTCDLLGNVTWYNQRFLDNVFERPGRSRERSASARS